MSYITLRPQSELVTEQHRDGHKLYRTELYVHRRLVDVTLWADTPTEAIRDGEALAARWNQLRQWLPTHEAAA